MISFAFKFKLRPYNLGLAKRVIACLDVRSNDNGDLVVTKVGRCRLTISNPR